jgi:predicted TIM-barrel fold metal-dependent hydrolase
MSSVSRRSFLTGAVAAGGLGTMRERGGSHLSGASGAGTQPVSAKPFVVDVHVHMNDPLARDNPELWNRSKILYDGFQYVYDGKWQPRRRPERTFQGLDDLLQQMDRGGIAISLVQAGRPELLQMILDKNTRRLVPVLFATPTIDEWDNARRFETAVKQYGCRAIKLALPYQHFYPTDSRLMGIYRKAIELDVPVIFHSGWTPRDTADLEYGRPVHLDKLGIMFPDLKVNIAHTGIPWWEEALVVVSKHQNFYCDFSSWCTLPPRYLVYALDLARHLSGLGRVMFGTEQNLCEPGEMVQQLLTVNRIVDQYHVAPFDITEIHAMLGENAMRFFQLKRT